MVAIYEHPVEVVVGKEPDRCRCQILINVCAAIYTVRMVVPLRRFVNAAFKTPDSVNVAKVHLSLQHSHCLAERPQKYSRVGPCHVILYGVVTIVYILQPRIHQHNLTRLCSVDQMVAEIAHLYSELDANGPLRQ